MTKRMAAFGSLLALACGIAAAGWWELHPAQDPPQPATELPLPPFPPRIASGDAYESCLAALANDPTGAVVMAETLQAQGQTDASEHCHGLALIALGNPQAGAATLENLAQTSHAPPMGKASVLAQAGQARLMVGQVDQAVRDATTALALSPNDADLFIMRAAAEDQQGRYLPAIDDLTQALALDPTRPDALVARAEMHRKLNQLDLAQADLHQALTLDPQDPGALLERGILRQRMGDAVGARQDWEQARGLDPNSSIADRAEQNLSLLEAGPQQQ
jgi:tetratricopeptide (TPR) repeat protein